MDEKLIVISIEDTIVDSFTKVFSPLGIHFYCIHNNLELVESLEFEGFVFVEAKFK